MIDRLLVRLPAGPAARTFLVVAFIDAAGRGLFLAGSALFFTQVIGLTTAQVGTGLSAAALCGLACGVPIGRLADRIGPGRMLIALQIWRAIGFVAYPFLSGFTQFLAVACFVGAVETAVGPILQSVAGAVAEGESLVRTMAMVAVVRNTAYAVSALVATLVITLAGTPAYVGFVLANAAAFLVTAVLLARLRLPRVTSGHEPGVAVKHLPWRDGRFVALALANGILYLHMVILSVALPLWIVTRTAAPKPIVGLALLINTVLAVTLQVRLSKGGDDVVRAGNLQRRAGFALVVFCGFAAASAFATPVVATALLLLAAVALTLGELWQSAGAWGVSFQLSPPHRRTYHLSLYNLGATGLAVAGPGVLSVAVIDQGPPGWLALAVVFALAGLAVPWIIRRRLEAGR